MSSPSTGPTFDLSRVGLETESQAMRVTEEATRRFAEATNDLNDDFVSGRLAPPVYALVPVLPVMVAAKSTVTRVFAVHGEHDIFFHEPLRPGMTLRATARVIGVHQRSAGVATIVLIETSTTSGTLVNRQYFASFAAGGQVEHSVGEDAPAHVPPPGDGPETTVTYPIDPDQTQRFAAAANDWDAYTLDDEIARSMGFPAKIVHGPCTLAFISRALVSNVCGGDATRLKRLAVRFARPLVLSAGQSLTTRIWSVGSSDGIERYGFEATDKEGVVTAKNGWAEVGR